MSVAIVTDSSACVPRSKADELGIHVVSIQLMIDGEPHRATDVARSELFAALGRGAETSTAGPTPGDFMDTIDDADQGDGVVVITLASSMSTTHNNAKLAAQQALGEVEVVDSGSAAGGHALVAIAAARASRDGADLSEVAATARDVASEVRLVATVGSLEALARSGRVPSLAQKTGDALGVRPLFEFDGGDVHVLMPSLAEDRAVGRLVRRCLDDRPDEGFLRASVLHADRRDVAERVMSDLKGEVGDAEVFISEFDAAMIVHTGPDVVGLAWWWDTTG